MTTSRIKPTRAFSDKSLDYFRQQGDPPADAVIQTLVAEEGRDGVSALMRWLADAKDLEVDSQPAVVARFIAEHSALPGWADRNRMSRGMAFFAKHAPAIGLVLGTYALPYTYLGASGVQVLWLTERIKNDTARRLQETGEWVFAVNNSKRWVHHEAIVYTLKIRLIHAASRWFARHTGRWNEAWGMPICQEDMAGTVGAFGYIVLKGLRKMGISMTEQEEEDYLHHTNVIGYLNGVNSELLPLNLREAFHLDKQIARRQFAPTDAGRGLTKALLDAIETLSGRADTRNLAAAQMRFFLGDALADALAIPTVPFEQGLVGLVNRLPIFPALAPAAF